MFSDKILKTNLTPLTFDTGLFCKYITKRCFRHAVAFIKICFEGECNRYSIQITQKPPETLKLWAGNL